MSAGSLHSDEWKGPAVNLLSRDMICIKPVGGWWNNRASAKIRGQSARYALVISLKSEDATIDLHTPITTLINLDIPVETIVIPTLP